MTFTETLHPSIAGPASRCVFENHQPNLGDAVEQLAGLRFAIVLSARWEISGVLEGNARAELRDKLRQLRWKYSHKIDEIAINYGVQAAIEAQEGVEREVTVPKNMAPPLRHAEASGFHDI